jgi:CheY-like chemotaxis protein
MTRTWGETMRAERVLVVDDEPSVCEIVRRCLRQRCEVTMALEPRDVIALLLAGQRFDAILCDLRMPEMSGVALYRAIEGIDGQQAARLVFMSGDDEALATGRPLLPKPFDRTALLDALAPVVAGRPGDASPR